MRNSQRAAAVVALAVSFLVPVVSMANATEPNHGPTTSTEVKAKVKPLEAKHETKHETKHAKKAHNKVVHAGTVTAVSASSLTFTVHGGRDKALRGKSLVVVVTATTKVSRNDADSTIASVKVGDHVNVKGTKLADAYTAVRISASGL